MITPAVRAMSSLLSLHLRSTLTCGVLPYRIARIVCTFDVNRLIFEMLPVIEPLTAFDTPTSRRSMKTFTQRFAAVCHFSTSFFAAWISTAQREAQPSGVSSKSCAETIGPGLVRLL